MDGTFIRIYAAQNAKHHGKLVYEWVLEEARALGLPGGSVFRAIAGYGRHGALHEEHFFELAGEQPVVVEFFAEAALAKKLLQRIDAEGLSLFYMTHAATGSVSGSKTP